MSPGLDPSGNTVTISPKESPRLVFGMKKKRLKVTCYLEQICPKTRRVYERRKKFRLLEQELGCTIEVDVRSADALKQVA